MSGISIPAAARAVVKALEPLVRWGGDRDDPTHGGRLLQVGWIQSEDGERLPLFADMATARQIELPFPGLQTTYGGEIFPRPR